MRSILFFLALAGLNACSNSEHLAACRGPIFALNTGHWVPAPTDLQKPAPGSSE